MQTRKIRERYDNYAYFLLLPGFVLFIAFIAFPLFFSFILAFSDWNVFQGLDAFKFIGLDNFKALFSDSKFYVALLNNIKYVVLVVPITIILAILLSFLISEYSYGKKLFRSVFFIPYVTHIVALSHVFKMFFQPKGLLNNILIANSVIEEPLQWLSKANLVIVPIVLIGIITQLGYCMIVYLAALQNVPEELYEAARIDGANGFRRIFNITLPLTSPSIFFLVMTVTITCFKLFSSVKIFSQSAQANSFSVLVYEVYNNGFQFFRFGYASAIAWVLFAIIMSITAVQLYGEKKWVHYS